MDYWAVIYRQKIPQRCPHEHQVKWSKALQSKAIFKLDGLLMSKKKAFCFTNKNKIVVLLTCISSNILSLHWELKSYSYHTLEIPKFLEASLDFWQEEVMALRSRTSAQGNTRGFELSGSQDIFMPTHKCN